MILKKNYLAFFLSFLLIFGYFFIGYFLDRTNYYQLLFVWFSLFGITYYLVKNQSANFTFLVAIAILFRLVFLISVPNLSQDFYRFIWDGRMLFAGFNPYISLPQTFIAQHNYPIPEAVHLYAGMGDFNGSHYTNYAPINQLNFLIAALFANKSILGSVIILRLQIILADIGIIYFGKKILEKLQLPINNIFLYALNPFVIIELTGNLHFESVMLFFLVWSLYKLQQQKWIWAGILLGCSVSVKLIPLLFLPLFYQWFTSATLSNQSVINSKKETKNWTHKFSELTKLLSFYAIILGTIALLFLPFFSQTFVNSYTDSVGLWFKNFELNASFYYLFREIGYLFRGWNEIAIIGKIMPLLTVLFLLGITFFRKNTSLQQLITALLFGLSFYYFTTTTVHPWYLASLVILSVFTKYRFPIVWSLVIVFSYQVYATTPWKENLWWVFGEYLVVYGVLIFEVFRNKKTTVI